MTVASQRKTAFTRIHQVISPWAETRPGAPALKDAQRSLTYAELARATTQASTRLQHLGVRPGDRLLVVGENSVTLGVLVMAASALDAWVVVVNARLSAREIDNFIGHSGARRVLYTCAVSPEAAAHAARHGGEREQFCGLGALTVGPLNIAAVPEQVFADPAQQVAAMIYTSGTSGNPKGVMLTHANLLAVSDTVRTLRRLGPEDIIYGVLPMAHVVGLSSQLLVALLSGCTLVLEPRFAPERLAKALAEDRISILVGVPAMFARLLEWSKQTGTDLRRHNLRAAGVAGSPLTPTLKQDVEKALGMVLHNNYGLTEMSPTVAQTPLDAPRLDCSVGMPIPGVEVRIVDSAGEALGTGEVGELHLRGPGVMKGYYRNAELTREAIDADGWFNTRDLAKQDSDGALFIMGRTKELIIRSGFNVYPVEVEQVLNAHPDIVQSAVVGRIAGENEEIIAYVEATSDSTLTAASLEPYLRDRLSPYKIPAEIHFLERLPAAATGKILKSALKEMAAQRGSKAGEPT